MASATTPIGKLQTKSGALFQSFCNGIPAMRGQNVQSAEDKDAAKRLAGDFDIKRIDRRFSTTLSDLSRAARARASPAHARRLVFADPL